MAGGAHKAGMRFTKMDTLISDIDSKKTAISDKLNSIIEEFPGKVEACYSGQAANDFKSRLTSETNKIITTMDEMLKALKSNADEQKAAYEAKVKELAGTVKSSGGN